MRIAIDSSVANDPEAHQWLDRTLYRIEDGWHVWDTVNQPAPDELEATAWIRDRNDQGEWARELLVASIQRDAWTPAPHGRSVRVDGSPAHPGRPQARRRLPTRRRTSLDSGRESAQ